MSVTHIMILLAVVVLIFGTGKIRNIGSDLGGAIRDFKKSFETDGADSIRANAGADRDLGESSVIRMTESSERNSEPVASAADRR